MPAGKGTHGFWSSIEEGPASGAASPREGGKDHLTSFEGLAALSLDALSSVAYGPEAIVLVLVAAGTSALRLTLPVTVATAGDRPARQHRCRHLHHPLPAHHTLAVRVRDGWYPIWAEQLRQGG
jgi:hypothetical protein